MDAPFFVYILASQRNGTLYVGVTNNLARRVAEHKAKLVPGFTRKYSVDLLVYFEAFETILEARAREHAMKRWRRAWKIEVDRETQSGLAGSDGSAQFVVTEMGPGSAVHR
jgi:putative endonuclease